MKTLSVVHNALYRTSGGRVGGRIKGMPVLLLTTTGRKSGKRRVNPLLYVRDAENVVVVASNGGSASSPAWWLNLEADPSAEIEIGRRRLKVTAQRATGTERDRLWTEFTARYDGYATYATRTERDIPIVVLTPL